MTVMLLKVCAATRFSLLEDGEDSCFARRRVVSFCVALSSGLSAMRLLFSLWSLCRLDFLFSLPSSAKTVNAELLSTDGHLLRALCDAG